MGIISDISSVIGLAKKAKELADELKNLELKGVIVDLQGKPLDLKEEINTLREENEELKRQIKDAPVAGAAPKEMPAIKDGMYYKGTDGPFCTACYLTVPRIAALICSGARAFQILNPAALGSMASSCRSGI